MGYMSIREFSRSSKKNLGLKTGYSYFCHLLDMVCIVVTLHPSHIQCSRPQYWQLFRQRLGQWPSNCMNFTRYSDARDSFIDTTWASFKDRGYVSLFRSVPTLLLTMPGQTPITVTMGIAVLEDTLLASILAYYLHSKRTER